ncbi:MAG: PTS sugar transporter subunit IIB [Gemmatimonadales bacterium]|nr:MAG: PTS sugar transporter subunit IIB [Gemmatimonadales bacterium]
MSIVLYRVDERLIHGQVVLGWGRRLRPDRYLVVDDALADSDWEQDLYRLTVDGSAEVEFLTVDEGRQRLPEYRDDDRRTVLLTRDVDHMRRLAVGGLLAGEEVNLGGIHHRPGRIQVRSYIYLDEAERAELRALAEEGVTITGRDLPETHRVPLEAILG